MTEPLQEKRRKMGAFGLWALATTIVPGFSVLGFRALNASNQIWFYFIDLPGLSALPGFKVPFHGNGQRALNPGTTVSTFIFERPTFELKI